MANPLPNDQFEPQRALKTLLITDFVDSTAWVASMGDERAAQIFERHDCIARDLLADYHGIEIDKTDGFLFLFDRPMNAVRYALAYQQALSDFSKSISQGLLARIGIHLGEVVLRKNRPEFVARGAKALEVEGLAKPMTARIMSLAQGRQTLMTRSAFDVARRAAVGHDDMPGDLVWVDHGLYHFQGIVEPQSVCEVGCEGCSPLSPPPDSAKAWRNSSEKPDVVASWRPATGLEVPENEGWKLIRKVAESPEGEVWLARFEALDSMPATVGWTVNEELQLKTDERAVQFCYEAGSGDRAHGRPCWRIRGPLVCFVVLSGNQAGLYRQIEAERFYCGRDYSMDLQIADRRVSRRHFEVLQTPDGAVLHELKARNGVFVNGKQLVSGAKKLLRNGDEIGLGGTKLVFYDGGPLEFSG